MWPQPGAAPPPGPERQPYAAPQPQPFGNQQNVYPNYQASAAQNQQQQFWPPQPQQQQQNQFNQQYGQTYQSQDYAANANQFYQQPAQYSQNYTNQAYNKPPQQPANQQYQQNYYQNQGVQQNNLPQTPNADSWEENWDWGWEDSSKQAHKSVAQNSGAQQTNAQPQQQVFNNANVIEESFASTDSWNWTIEERRESRDPIPVQAQQQLKEPATLPVSEAVVENNTGLAVNAHNSVSNLVQQPPQDEVRNLSDREVVKERLPNLALGKRFHIENLTPQWSMESQMSQESSDGPQTQSESTYRSESQSRNSSKNSPGLNTDNSTFNYSQSGMDEAYHQNSEWSKHEEPTLVDSIANSSNRRESHDELSTSMQEMSLTNQENPSTDKIQVVNQFDSKTVQENIVMPQPPPSVSPANFPPPITSGLPPPPQPSSAMPPPPPVSVQASSSTAPMLPPPNNPPQSSSQNPFKHAGPFSHKSLGKTSNSAPVQAFLPPVSSGNLTSPAAVNKVSQHRVPVGFEANLETTPDNSERPDQPQMAAFRTVPVSQQIPDNLEVAPKNDRNEYLQTEHLSSGDYGENTNFSRNIPPPGLRRMVVGQQESEYNQNLNISSDDPPPAFARMVPGQQTEAENTYTQPNDTYMDRHIDGGPTDNSSRPYRQADGQQTPDNYNPPAQNRGSERRPIGLDRMVPGEPSNDEYSQYQGSNYVGANEQRVVTGLDHDYPIPSDVGPSDIREQNVDGSDYTEPVSRNQPRNVIGARESNNEVTHARTPEFVAVPDDQQREIIMEGENLQDLSIISSAELTFSREQIMDGADITITDMGTDRKTDASDSLEHPVTSSRKQSLNRVNTSGEESERDRTFKASPRRDRDKHKSSRDRDRERDRDKEGRYSRGDRKYEREADRRSGRDERRPEKDRRDKDRERRDRDESPDVRRHRRSTRSHRYETEDTDYYSDKERDRRRYREGSYTSSKPPRPDDKDRRYGDERDRTKRYNTIERDRRYDDERDGTTRSRRSDRHRDRDRYERRYRDIDPTRKYGNLRREREEDDHRRGDAYSSPSRAESREATATDDDLNESRRRPDAHRRSRHARADPYYDGYGNSGVYSDPYAAQRQQYEYYEHLRLTNPAAYMQVYKQIMAGHPPPPPPPDFRVQLHANKLQPQYGEGYGSLGYETRTEERGSVHSGRSSTNGLKGNETDVNTDVDASLNLHLEESTVRSERMTPFRFSTAHIKGSISSRHIVVVRPSYPVDGLPATVQILSLADALANDPATAELANYPGPLVKGVTHKKSVIEFCTTRARSSAGGAGARDRVGYALLWDLLALLLRQNGVVVGSDIAELLMKNTREYEHKTSTAKTNTHNESRRGSSVSGGTREEDTRSSSPDPLSVSTSEVARPEKTISPGQQAVDERTALDQMREHLIYGNRQQALECAMSGGLWGHALVVGAASGRRARAAVAARFLASLPPRDPLRTLYATLTPAATAHTCVVDERSGDWRPHAAIILSNPSSRPDHDQQTLLQLGDSLSSRGLIYSAQFCYVAAGATFERHPLAPLSPAAPGSPPATPPRLSLLLADPRAPTLAQFATNLAIFATEVYEYALSLTHDHVIPELQVYKYVMSARLVDGGQYERALGYAESAARAITHQPHHYSPLLLARLACLADRLKYHEPALAEPPLLDEGPGEEGSDPASPHHHHQWLHDLTQLAHTLTQQQTDTPSQQSQQVTPQHQNKYYQQQQYGWGEQAQQYQQPTPSYPEPVEESQDTPQYYQPPQQLPQPPQPDPEPPAYGEAYPEDWQRSEEQHQTYADPYWQPDQYGYGEVQNVQGVPGAVDGGEPAEEVRPTITMPGTTAAKSPLYGDYDDDRPPSAENQEQQKRDTDNPKSGNRQVPKSGETGKDGKGKSGWFGGILTKLSLRPPNQMILPDDSNPTIVWDPENKRWLNKDGDADDADRPPPPPPKMSDLAPALKMPPAPALGQPPAAGAPPIPAVSNIFKMQKGRHIKNSYVDVFNPGGAAGRASAPAPGSAGEAPAPGPPAPLAPAPQFFMPQPLTQPQSGIYDPSQAAADDGYYNSGI